MDVESSDLTQSLPECPNCGTEMPVEAQFCPGCGQAMRMPSMEERSAATISYLTLVPAAVVLLLPMFRRSSFARFHAWQSVFLWAIFLVLTGIALALSNVAAAVVFLLVGIITCLGMAFLWGVLSLKAFQGARFKLPLLGPLAERLR